MDRSDPTALLTFAWSVVGATSTPEVEANETTPTLTSSGTVARNSLTAARTVAIPEASIDPLVSMTSIVDRSMRSAGWTLTFARSPPMVAPTDEGLTLSALEEERRTRVAFSVLSVTRTSLSVDGTSADAAGAASTGITRVAATTAPSPIREKAVRTAVRAPTVSELR